MIEKTLLEGLKNMILSPDSSDISMAVDIIDLHTDEESKKNILELTKMVVDNDKLFPKHSFWVASTPEGRILRLGSKSAFHSETACRSALSKHFTNKIGTSKTAPSREIWNLEQFNTLSMYINADNIEEFYKKHIKAYNYYYSQKSPKPTNVTEATKIFVTEYNNRFKHIDYKIQTVKKNLNTYPVFDLKQAKRSVSAYYEQETFEQLKKHDKYSYILKKMFRGGREMREFMVNNNLIIIKRI